MLYVELYVSELETQGENSDEWINSTSKKWVLYNIGKVKIDKAIKEAVKEEYKDATEKVSEAISKLNEVEECVGDLLDDIKISELAADNIIECNGLARETLYATISKPDFLLGTEITVEPFHCTVEVEGKEYTVLVYECNPTGLVFNEPVPLEVPFALLKGNKEPIAVLYSQDGEEIEEADIDYDIDRDEETITFYVPHFTVWFHIF